MGFLDTIKGMFSKKPETVEEIQFENIEEWFSKKLSSKEDFLKGQLEGIKAGIAEQASEAKTNMESLRTAQLRNPNIPEKAKHYMQGNRETYLRMTAQFLEHLNVPSEHNNLDSFFANFDARVSEFGKQTARPYAILKEFFEEEASRIAANISRIAALVKEIRQAVESSRISEMKAAKEDIESIKSKKSQKQSLAEEIAKKRNMIEELREERAKLDSKMADRKESREFKDYRMLRQKLENTKKKSAEKEAEVAHVFSSLERPMKKYLRTAYSDKGMLEEYIKSPVSALAQDFGLKIVPILGNMKKAITDNTLELKERQKEKALSDIEALDREFLSKFMSDYAQIRKKENEIKKELKSMAVIDEIRDLKEQLSIKDAMIEKAKKDMESLNSDFSKIDTEKMKSELAETLGSATESKVVIS